MEGMRAFQEITDFVYSFLSIMLEHSMRLKDGWKVEFHSLLSLRMSGKTQDSFDSA